MIVGNYIKLRNSGQFRAGDTIWACEFYIQDNKEAARFVSKPVKGIIAAAKTEKVHNEILQEPDGYTCLNYFVPFKKDGVSLAWSKAVSLHAREYATTEEDCVTLYNERVCRYISWLNTQVSWANEQLIKRGK